MTRKTLTKARALELVREIRQVVIMASTGVRDDRRQYPRSSHHSTVYPGIMGGLQSILTDLCGQAGIADARAIVAAAFDHDTVTDADMDACSEQRARWHADYLARKAEYAQREGSPPAA